MTKGWNAEAVAEADDRETAFSPGVARVETPDYLLMLVPGSYALTYVRRFQCDAEHAESTIEEILRHVRTAGGTGLRWVINSRTRPGDLVHRLLRRGFRQIASAETLYFVLGSAAATDLPRLRVAGSISTREAHTDEEVDLFVRLGVAIFGDPPPPSEYLENLRSQVRRSVEATGHSELFLVFDDGIPVGRGGLTVTGPVGRLWTSGVLSEHRGRGAYQALTHERCRVALERGAEIALTHARIDTSGAILKRHGFQSAGPYDYYEVRWGAEGR